MEFLKKLFDTNEKELKRLRQEVEKINAWEPEIQRLTDAELRGKTDEFRKRIAEGLSLDDLLPEAFSVVREASIRTLGMRHFDVQMIGGIVLHEGRIAEMKTGEGKTLVATLPLYLNALSGSGVHLITVNDFLSRRDACWNGPLFEFLGLTVGCIHGQSAETGTGGGSYVYDAEYESEDPIAWDKLRPVSRRDAYAADITYGTNHEFGFDYLRDNMVYSAEDLSQRELNYAIVDEVDSILVDEARTPLIISGRANRSSDMYIKMDRVVRRLENERHYTIDEKAKSATLTEEGQSKVEEIIGCSNLTDPENIELAQYVNASLKAHAVFRKDIDYVVKDGQIVIVDEFTGRLMFGRRWSNGMHQAVEAKEGCSIRDENQTLATITYQNYFRLYNKLSGMTGTAATEENEFRKIYALDVMVIPTNRPVIRQDMPDVVYKTEEAKFRGLSLEILKAYTREQPTLVGTRSIEVSERVSERLISERLQLLVACVLVQIALDNTKQVSGEERGQFEAMLNAPFHMLDVPKIAKIAKHIGYDLDVLGKENMDEFAELVGIRPHEMDKFYDALKNGIDHSVLNAKFHEQEAEIISHAGERGAVTIATNMAGRGVDITLGGPEDELQEEPDGELLDESQVLWDFAQWKKDNPDKYERLTKKQKDVVMRGGLYVIGSERHESRRIDNQLRGRSGRQGDPGMSKFFVSMEDELQRLFGDRSKSAMLGGWKENEPLDARLLSRVIERSQKKVEEHHFDIRKHVLEYDEVMNDQREIIYSQRRKILEGADLRTTVLDYLEESVQKAIDQYCPEGVPPDEWDTEGLFSHINHILPLETYAKSEDLRGIRREALQELLMPIVEKSYEAKENEVGPELMRDVERHVVLDLINRKWIEHLEAMDFLREGINLRGYAQRDPLIEYKKEAYDIFMVTTESIKEDLARIMYRVQTDHQPARRRMSFSNVREHGGDAQPAVASSSSGPQTATQSPSGNPAQGATAPMTIKKGEKIGRNDPCPCGSGKKFKKCCMGKVDNIQ